MKYRIIKQKLPYGDLYKLQEKRHWFSRWEIIEVNSYREVCENTMEKLILVRDSPCEVVATEKKGGNK